MKTCICIPARLESTRLPRKLLREVNGKSLLWHTVNQALKCHQARQVHVIADDARLLDSIEDLYKRHDRLVVHLSCAHANSGTERIAQMIQSIHVPKCDYVVNWQADEPSLPWSNVDRLIRDARLIRPHRIYTMSTPFQNDDESKDPDVVKVVCDRYGRAMWFGRVLHSSNKTWSYKLSSMPKRHIGIYLFPIEFLTMYSPVQCCELARLESLEQLDWLWNGHEIYVDNFEDDATQNSFSIDTEEDFTRFELLMKDLKNG